MLFNSLTFLLLHTVSLILYWAIPNQRFRLSVLLVASFIFYGWFYWPGLILLSATIFINFLLSWVVDRYRKKWIFVLTIIINLTGLSWFKYSGFIIENIHELFDGLGIALSLPEPSYWLPLGISFYTFQFLGYFIDLYKGEISREKSLLHFAVFKCLYAQLIAGPIVRGKELLPQLHILRRFEIKNFQRGFFLMLGGLFIKICVADILSQFVNYGFDPLNQISTLHAWLSLYGFAFQILSDFWGYSTIAIGIGLMYGIILPENFNFPYISKSLQEFWRRWHITLSFWFRDYVYIPLGGNRGRLPYKNVIITMTIAGLWHGAGWNFIIWGLGHGVLLSIERFLGLNKSNQLQKWKNTLRIIVVFHFVCILWVFFRAPDFGTSVYFLDKLFIPPYTFDIAYLESFIIVLLLFAFFHVRLGKLFRENNFQNLSLPKQLVLCILMILLILAYADAQLDFIYFVF